jgi:uncharacterized phage-associated protein
MIGEAPRMAHHPKAIANYFLDKAESEGRKLTPLQVIKLTFVAHGWHLGLSEKPLVSEPPEAWKYGPVFRSLYREFRDYGDEPIDGRATTYSNYVSENVPPPSPKKEEALCKFLDQVWRGYGHFTGIQLSAITHREGSPWHVAWYDLGGQYTQNFVIPEDLIIKYYKALQEKNARSRQG